MSNQILRKNIQLLNMVDKKIPYHDVLTLIQKNNNREIGVIEIESLYKNDLRVCYRFLDAFDELDRSYFSLNCLLYFGLNFITIEKLRSSFLTLDEIGNNISLLDGLNLRGFVYNAIMFALKTLDLLPDAENTFDGPIEEEIVWYISKHEPCPNNTLKEYILNKHMEMDSSEYDGLIDCCLKKHKKYHNKDHFYKIRSLDRDEKLYSKLTVIEKAARTIYLNKTCFNGLYRVNKKGQFNTPIGRYTDPLICDEETIREASRYLKSEGIKFLSCDFVKSVSEAKKGDWIYFDPPYDYEDTGFVGYNKEGFSHNDLLRLRKLCDELIEKGCHVLISNNDTKLVRKTFEADKYEIIYSTKVIKANRNINSKGSRRAKVDEVLIYGRKAK